MSSVKFDFSDKVVLITGASSGIGRATALKFAASGAMLLLADIDIVGGMAVRDEITDGGSAAIFCRTDVGSMLDCQGLVDAGIGEFGHLDIAFNNAGVSGRPDSLEGLSEAEWQLIMNVNLSGVFNCMQHEIRAMQNTGGVIVNNSSVMGLTGTRGAAAYCAAKHGVVGLTRAAAMDYGRIGIRINAICPGFVRTAMTDSSGNFSQKALDSSVRKTALARIGECDEIAEAVLWLCSDSAAYVCGAALAVDGGYTAN